MGEPTRVLFIGGWGHHYLRSFLTEARRAGDLDVELAACGDGVDDMARLMADTEPAVAWIDDPTTALGDFAPAVVSIGAVYNHNGVWIERALRAGCAVVSDKPIAPDQARLDTLRDLVAGDPAAVVVTEVNARYQAEFRTAARSVADGRIGAPVLAIAQKSYPFGARPPWYDDPASYPGTVLWVATHAFDFTEFVTGRMVTPLMGRAANQVLAEFPSVSDHTVTVCALEGGGTAVVHADYLRPTESADHGDDRLRVAGSEGVIEVRGGRCWLHVGDRPQEITDETAGAPVGAALWQAVRAGDPVETERSLRLAEVALAARAVTEPRG